MKELNINNIVIKNVHVFVKIKSTNKELNDEFLKISGWSL